MAPQPASRRLVTEQALASVWRDVRSLISAEWTADQLLLGRAGSMVFLTGACRPVGARIGVPRVTRSGLLDLPVGFRPGTYTYLGPLAITPSGVAGWVSSLYSTARIDVQAIAGTTGAWATDDVIRFTVSWPTRDPAPTTWPGSPG